MVYVSQPVVVDGLFLKKVERAAPHETRWLQEWEWEWGHGMDGWIVGTSGEPSLRLPCLALPCLALLCLALMCGPASQIRPAGKEKRRSRIHPFMSPRRQAQSRLTHLTITLHALTYQPTHLPNYLPPHSTLLHSPSYTRRSHPQPFLCLSFALSSSSMTATTSPPTRPRQATTPSSPA
ncbi:hypothetical protein IWX47DRAFT_188126 [Phyllosticta citricarpa]